MPALIPVTHAHPLELHARASRPEAFTEAMDAMRRRTADLSCIVAGGWVRVLVSSRATVVGGMSGSRTWLDFEIGRYCLLGVWYII